MDGLLAGLEERRDPARFLLATYRRTPVAVQEELARGGFADRDWVERLGRRLRRSLPGRPGVSGRDLACSPPDEPPMPSK